MKTTSASPLFISNVSSFLITRRLDLPHMAATLPPPSLVTTAMYYEVPVKFSAADRPLATVLVSFVVYMGMFRFFEALYKRFPQLLPPDLTPKESYDITYRSARLLYFIAGALLMLPSTDALLEYLLNDDAEITLPSHFHKNMLELAGAMSVAPLIFDVSARREIHWSGILHHVTACLTISATAEFNVGVALGIFHTTTTHFTFTADISRGLCVLRAPARLCAWWLDIAKWNLITVYVLAQVAILRTTYKLYNAALVTNGGVLSVTTSVGFAAGLLLDCVLHYTQWYTISIVASMARRKHKLARTDQI